MNLLSAAAAVVVGAAFVLAAGTKLAAREQWASQAGDLGAPGVVVPVLPWIELATGAALIAGVARPWAAAVAIVLLIAFSVLIAVRLGQGRRPACACFGAWSASPIGPGHLVRNGALLALAILALRA